MNKQVLLRPKLPAERAAFGGGGPVSMQGEGDREPPMESVRGFRRFGLGFAGARGGMWLPDTSKLLCET